MERWERDKPHHRGNHTAAIPSFSSTLLDAAYRSIDESDGPNLLTSFPSSKPREAPDPYPHRRHHPAKHNDHRRFPDQKHAATISISTSTSSESSYGGFSSSEPDSARAVPRPPPSKASRFRPSRIYGELKKARSTPVSPGARLASFINSLFSTSGRRRRPNPPPEVSPTAAFSRSCLAGMAPPKEELRRSVRFHPVSVIVGDEVRDRFVDFVPPPLPALRVRSAAEEREGEVKLGLRFGDETEEDEDDDDVASCSSSDLFELESLTTVMGGGERYRDELPVYETTHVRTNRAIARGLIV